VALVSLLCHISADFMNDYGVHPFAPFWPHWIYGGVMFIVEPLLWAALLPLAVLAFSSKPARGIWIAFSAFFLGLLWLTHTVSWPVALASTLFFALCFYWQWIRRGVIQSIVCGLSVILVFSIMGHRAERLVREKIAKEQPEERVTQLVTTPSPGNPFCWQVIPVSKLSMDGLTGQVSGKIVTPYFERVGAVSFWPSFFAPESCAFRFDVERTAPLMKASLTSDANVYWAGEFRGTVESLAASASGYCRFGQFLRWARVPFFFKIPGNILIGGDLRYDHEPGLGFAELEFAQTEACLPHAPNWDNPSGLLPSGPQERPGDQVEAHK
jgi:inner membrane protein